MMVTLPMQNPLSTGDYIVFTSQLNFLSQKCSVSNVNVTCSID